jgi:hypothetical protein
LCISGTPGLSISEKKPMLGLSPRGQSANRPVYGRAVAWGRHDVAFCTRHYMRCPAPPRPAARINSRAPAYYSAGSCPALRERLSSRVRTQPWTPKAPPDASVYPLRPPPTNSSRTAHPSSRKSSKRTTS